MTKKDIQDIIIENQQDGKKSSMVAGKLIRLDIFKMGIDGWIEQSSSEVAESFVDVANMTISVVIENLKSRMAGEQLIDEIGIIQSDRVDFEEIEKFHHSVLDTFEVLSTYLRILEIAKQKQDERNNE